MSIPQVFDILLIEDNLGDIRLTREAFKELDTPCQLQAITDGDSAIKYLLEQQQKECGNLPHLILLDLNLPKRDGKEVLSVVKQHAQLQHIPVVVLSTSAAETDIAAAYSLHANSYMVKPIDFDDFLSLVRLIEQYWLRSVALPPNRL